MPADSLATVSPANTGLKERIAALESGLIEKRTALDTARRALADATERRKAALSAMVDKGERATADRSLILELEDTAEGLEVSISRDTLTLATLREQYRKDQLAEVRAEVEQTQGARNARGRMALAAVDHALGELHTLGFRRDEIAQHLQRRVADIHTSDGVGGKTYPLLCDLRSKALALGDSTVVTDDTLIPTPSHPSIAPTPAHVALVRTALLREPARG